MLSRCKGKHPTGRVRCTAIPASSSSFPRTSASAKIHCDSARNQEDESWKTVLNFNPTLHSKWRTLQLQRNRSTLRSDFFHSRRIGRSRTYTTDAKQGVSSSSSSSQPSPDEANSLFNTSLSAWDHVFENIEDQPALSDMPTQPRPRSSGYTSPIITKSRSQTMTARELDAFNSMFNMIFAAVSKDAQRKRKLQEDALTQGPEAQRPRTAADRRADRVGKLDPLSGVGIGMGPDGSSGVLDIVGSLRRVSRKFRWSPAEDTELEFKRGQLELCETDQQLLEWAAREVFDESARYEEAARQALVRNETKNQAPFTSTSGSPDANAKHSHSSRSHNPIYSPLPVQPPSYPHLLATLICTFRNKFNDPHLALSIFNHARTRSIASYVFGCTAPAYNELLRTRWSAFKDLRGVADALEEMRVNGVKPDAKTREIVEELRREVGARTIWQEERNIGTGEVLELINRIESLVREPVHNTDPNNNNNNNNNNANNHHHSNQQQQRQKKTWQDAVAKKKQNQHKGKKFRWRTSDAESWKSGTDGDSGDGYEFGDWKAYDKASSSRQWNSSSSNHRKPYRDDNMRSSSFSPSRPESKLEFE